ncbi:HEAT repeat domain-containing protein [Chloroflexi bacterium TSY]|nr:HEAT repeat domain-containing protein [Chloroflexi bacterium TSY]
MDLFLSPEVHQFLLNAGANTAGGLGAVFATHLINASLRGVRTLFGESDERMEALGRAAGQAVFAMAKDWKALPEDYQTVWDNCYEWLLAPVVVGEFRKLLSPKPNLQLDILTLREEFEATGLDVTELGKPDFDALVQDMVGAFYLAAAEEPLLQEPLKIGVLRQMTEGMNALTRLQEQEVQLTRRSLAELERLNTMADGVVDQQLEAVDLLRAILEAIETIPQGLSDQQRGYQEVAALLSRADLGSLINVGEIQGNSRTIVVGNNASVIDSGSPELTDAIEQLNKRMARIADGLQARESELSDAEMAQLEENYRQTLIDQFEMLTFRGISPSGKALALKLEDVYVELKTIAEVPEAADTYSAEERRFMLEMEGQLEREEVIAHLDALRLERWRSEARQARKAEIQRLERRSISDVIGDQTQRGLVILGDPGSGKSTLLHYLALTHARCPAGETLPIFVPLAAYDDYRRHNQGIALADFLAIYYERWRSLPGLAPLFAQALNSGRALLLLDGLDEVLETTMRQHVAEQAGSLIANWQGRGNRFVLTSRVVGYREARLPGDLPHVTVLDFGPQEIEIFAHQWCRAFEIWAAGRETPTAIQAAAIEEENLLGDVRSKASVEQLAANPLLLTMLAILRRQVGKLPDRRVELYERYVRTLIDNREQERSRGARQQTPERFDPHRAIGHLMELALWLQLHRASGTARRHDLEAALADICLRYEGHDPNKPVPEKARIQAQQDAAAFLHDMRAIAGLLAERGRDAFGFLHLTFQEYFAGRALARLDPQKRWETLRPHLHKPRWREPILLCAGQLGVIEQRQDQVSNFVQQILTAESDDEEILHRDLFLAAGAMADDVGLIPALLETLYARTSLLHTSNIPTLQNAALTALTHLARIGQGDALRLLIGGLGSEALYQPILENTQPLLDEKALSSLRIAITAKLQDAHWSVRIEAVSVLGSLVDRDTQTKEAIMAKLQDTDEDVCSAAVSALGSLVGCDTQTKDAIAAKLQDTHRSVRSAAVSALGSLVGCNTQTKDAIAAKLQDTHWSVRSAAVSALGSLVGCDTQTKKAIAAKLQDADKDVRSAAVSALGSLVGRNPQTKKAITAKLQDTHWSVRSAAVSALGSLVGRNPQTKKAIMAKLQDADKDVRSAAVRALGSLVGHDTQTKDAITAKLQDADKDVRSAAVRALGSLVGRNPQTKEAIAAKLQDDFYDVCIEAMSALGSLVGHDTQTKEAIAAKLQDADKDVRSAAVRMLASLVGHDTQTKDAIAAKLQDAHWSVRREAMSALGSLVGHDTQTKDAIAAKLQDAHWSVRREAVRTLGSLVGHDTQTKDAIAAKLQDAHWSVRREAMSALGGLVGRDTQTKGAIAAKLQDDNEYVRREAVRALGSLVVHDTQTKDAIAAKLQDDNEYVRREAVRALGSLVVHDTQTKDAITAKLQDDNEYVRRAAVRVLGSLVGRDTQTKDAIMAKFQDDFYDVRSAAVRALGSLVGRDAQTKKAITAKLQDNSISVRCEAVSALLPHLDVANKVLFVNWLGIITERDPRTIESFNHDEARQQLSHLFAQNITPGNELYHQVVSLLEARAWPQRFGAAMTLIGMPDGPPPELLPNLRHLLDDMRGEESWPNRLTVAQLFINDTDRDLSRQSIELCIEALDYATQPWYHLPQSGAEVRRQAATILGQLEPLYRNRAIFDRLARLMKEDSDPQVRDAAYGALLRLAAAPEEKDSSHM